MNRAQFLLVAALFACHQPPHADIKPMRVSEDYCWWAVMRSPLPPDSVAARFQRAFTTLGLTGVTVTRATDTTWVHGGPTVLRDRAGTAYESRVIAYWHGDSTHYRHYVAVSPRPDDFIPFCQSIGREAAVGGSAPQRQTGEETLKLWTRER